MQQTSWQEAEGARDVVAERGGGTVLAVPAAFSMWRCDPKATALPVCHLMTAVALHMWLLLRCRRPCRCGDTWCRAEKTAAWLPGPTTSRLW